MLIFRQTYEKNDPEGPENGMFPMEIETNTKIIDFRHVLQTFPKNEKLTTSI